MAYIVNTFDEVAEYLHTHADIPDGVRQRVIEAYLRDLAEHADEFLKQAPLAHESYMFQYDYLLLNGGFCYSFRFIVDGSGMPFGIVQVIYIDFEKWQACLSRPRQQVRRGLGIFAGLLR